MAVILDYLKSIEEDFTIEAKFCINYYKKKV